MRVTHTITTDSKLAAKAYGIKMGKEYPIVGATTHRGYQYYYIVNEKQKSTCICPLYWCNMIEVKEKK